MSNLNKAVEAAQAVYEKELNLDKGSAVIAPKDVAGFTATFCERLKEATGLEFTEETFNKTTKAIATETNGILAAGAKLSAEGFKSSEENDRHRLDVKLGTGANIGGHWDRSKTFTPNNPATGEKMEERTTYNNMSGGSFAIAGSAKSVRDYSKKIGGDLLGE